MQIINKKKLKKLLFLCSDSKRTGAETEETQKKLF